MNGFKIFTAVRTGAVCRCALFFIFLLVTCPSFGQVLQKRTVTEADYALWGNMYFDQISDDGKWVSYLMTYDDKASTISVRSSNGKQKYEWADAYDGRFSSGRFFGVMLPDNHLVVVDLSSGKMQDFSNVVSYVFSSDARRLTTFEKRGDERFLVVRNDKLEIVKEVSNVSGYKCSANGSVVAYSKSDGGKSLACMLSYQDLTEVIVAKSAVGTFTNFIWQDNGASFAFLENFKTATGFSNNIYHYTVGGKNLKFLNANRNDFPNGMSIPIDNLSLLKVSFDGTKVFFGIMDAVAPTDYADDQIQVWNGNDTWFYPERKTLGGFKGIQENMVWLLGQDKLLQLTDNALPRMMMNGNQSIALVYNPVAIGPQYTLNPVADIYLLDVQTGVKTLWLEKQSLALERYNFSANGRYVAYFRDGNWFSYDFRLKTHRNLTENINSDWWQLKYLDQEPFGCAGWYKDGESLLLHDAFDIWKIYPGDKTASKKLTNGAASGTTFRVSHAAANPLGVMNFDRYTDATIDANHLIVNGATDLSSGYYLLNKKGKLKTLVKGNFRIISFRKAARAAAYSFIKETYDVPSAIFTIEESAKLNLVVQSNDFYQSFKWGKDTLIEYENSKKVKSKALLYYPANYDASKKYPMVVHIYERQSDYLHQYVKPTFYNEDGFNISVLTTNGYFVLMPDIPFRQNDAGVSATDAVVSVTQKIINLGLVDAKRIGLTGHSFGGYETNFIISQTNMFAAAVSGSGFGDTQSQYFSMSWNYGQPEIFRYEGQQGRMEHSFFEDRDSYDRNNPIRFAQNITTPVFIWSGEADRQVHYYNSIGFYLALRRLNKKQMLVLYPNEMHSLENPIFQKDLTVKFMDWFDFHLKGNLPKSWIKDGI